MSFELPYPGAGDRAPLPPQTPAEHRARRTLEGRLIGESQPFGQAEGWTGLRLEQLGPFRVGTDAFASADGHAARIIATMRTGYDREDPIQPLMLDASFTTPGMGTATLSVRLSSRAAPLDALRARQPEEFMPPHSAVRLEIVELPGASAQDIIGACLLHKRGLQSESRGVALDALVAAATPHQEATLPDGFSRMDEEQLHLLADALGGLWGSETAASV